MYRNRSPGRVYKAGSYICLYACLFIYKTVYMHETFVQLCKGMCNFMYHCIFIYMCIYMYRSFISLYVYIIHGCTGLDWLVYIIQRHVCTLWKYHRMVRGGWDHPRWWRLVDLQPTSPTGKAAPTQSMVFITFICNTLGPSFKLQYFYTQDTVMHNPYFNFLLLQPQFKIT